MNYQNIYLKDYYDFLGENGKNPKIEIYLPFNMTEMNRQNDKRPTILVCPGGGYGMCSQREAEPIAFNFLKYGYNVIVLWYSVKPHTFPSQITEVAAAVDLMHKNADEWNIDTQKIAIMGFSAGGHLAAHYSNCYDCDEVRERFPNSYPVNASVLAYPVITLKDGICHRGSFQNLSGKTEFTKEDIEKFSIENKISEKTPPAFIWHTAEDSCVPVYNSLLYAKGLSEYKIPYELHIYPFGWHGLATADTQTNSTVPESVSIVNSWMEEANTFLQLIFNK